MFFLFIYFFYCFDRHSYLYCRCCATIPFVAGIIDVLCVAVVVVVAKLMRMFSILVLLCVPYFTVNSVDE